MARGFNSGTRRNVPIFGATSFLNDTATEMGYWVLPAFLTSLGAGPAQLGLIEGVAESVASFAKLGAGYVTDRFPRRKPLVVFGYALANAVKPLLAVATAWWHVFLIRFADRAGKGVRGVPRDVMLSESVPRERLGASFGILQAMDSAGAIAGPLLALWVLSHFSLRGVFWAAAVPGLLSVALVAFAAKETGTTVSVAPAAPPDGAPASVAPLPASFYWVLAAVGIFSLGNSSDMFLVLRAQESGFAAAYAPLLGLVFNVVYAVASWPAGRLADRVDKRFVAAAGFLVYAFVYAVFAAAPSRAALWGGMALYGLYYALTNPVLRALVAESVPQGARGRAFGLFHFVLSGAVLVASLATGELWKRWGAALPLSLSATLAVVAAVMLLLAPRAATAASSDSSH